MRDLRAARPDVGAAFRAAELAREEERRREEGRYRNSDHTPGQRPARLDVRLTAAESEQLRAYADAHRLSMSRVVILALRGMGAIE